MIYHGNCEQKGYFAFLAFVHIFKSNFSFTLQDRHHIHRLPLGDHMHPLPQEGHIHPLPQEGHIHPLPQEGHIHPLPQEGHIHPLPQEHHILPHHLVHPTLPQKLLTHPLVEQRIPLLDQHHHIQLKEVSFPNGAISQHAATQLFLVHITFPHPSTPPPHRHALTSAVKTYEGQKHLLTALKF